MLKHFKTHDTGHWLLIGFLIILPAVSRFPYLCGLVADNPMVLYSGLFTDIKPGIFPGLDTIDPNIVYTALALGHRAALDWLTGSIPWWNPYEGVGAPLAAEMQSTALFMPFILLFSLTKGQIFFQIILQAIAGISTYLLLRQLGLSRLSAGTGGALFELCGTFMWLRNASSNPIAFLPLLLLGIEKAYNNTVKNKAGYWTAISIAIAASLYAGFPETAYIDGLMALAWTAVRFFCLPHSEMFLFFRKVFIGLLVGIMLAAPILVPFLTYLPLAYTGPHMSNEWAHFALPIEYLPQIFMPYIYGPLYAFQHSSSVVIGSVWPNLGGYLGASPLFLCMLNIFNNKQKAVRLMLTGWIVLDIAKSFDLYPISDFFNLLPFINVTGIGRYSVASWDLAAIILLSFSLDQLRLSLPRRDIAFWFLALSISAFFLLPLFASFDHLRDLVQNPQAIYWIIFSIVWALIFSLATGLIAILYSPSKLKVCLISALTLIELFVLFFIPALSNPRAGVIKLGGVHFLQQHLGLNRFYSLGPIEPNLGSYYSIASINENDNPIPNRWKNYVRTHLYRSDIPYYHFTGTNNSSTSDSADVQLIKNLENYKWVGVKYVVTQPQLNINAPSIKLVYHDEVMNIYELSFPKPYFEIVNDTSDLTAHSRNELEVTTTKACTLLRRELFFPGWSATINNCYVPISMYSMLFQTINLPAGHCHIRFMYTPPYTNYAAAALAIACLVLIFRKQMTRF